MGVKPDILLVSVIFFTLFLGKTEGLKAAIFTGLFKDITSVSVLGSNVFAFCLCALILGNFKGHFYKKRISTQLFLCATLYYVVAFIIFFINYAVTKTADVYLNIYHWMILKASIYTGVVSPLVFFILAGIFRSVIHKKEYI